MAEPVTRTEHKIKVRARATGGTGTIRAALFEGEANRSGFLESAVLTSTLAEYTLPIPDAGAASIVSYDALEIQFWGYSDAGAAATFEVDQVWLETPEFTSGLAAVGVSLAMPSTLAARAGVSLALPFKVRDEIGQSLVLPSKVRSLAGRSLAVPYTVRGSSGRVAGDAVEGRRSGHALACDAVQGHCARWTVAGGSGHGACSGGPVARAVVRHRRCRRRPGAATAPRR